MIILLYTTSTKALPTNHTCAYVSTTHDSDINTTNFVAAVIIMIISQIIVAMIFYHDTKICNELNLYYIIL